MNGIEDLYAGRSEIDRCSARTVQQLAKALGCSMEDLMELSSSYDSRTGLPKDRSYLEKGLPPFLTKSIEAMKAAWRNHNIAKFKSRGSYSWNREAEKASVFFSRTREKRNFQSVLCGFCNGRDWIPDYRPCKK